MRLPRPFGDGRPRRFRGAWICGRIGGVDERAVHVLDQAGAALAVENERLERELRARLEEERALRPVATLVAQQHEPERRC